MYRINIDKLTEVEGEKYPKSERVYEQTTDKDIDLKKIIDAFNEAYEELIEPQG